jgi:two-component system, OmpR family, phosphate regulon sensor histidine kinase PhoR
MSAAGWAMSAADGAILALALLAALGSGLLLGRRMGARPAAAPRPIAEPATIPGPVAVAADRISVEALADPALIVAGDVAIAANSEARRLFGDRITGGDLRLTVRHPVVLDALAEARGSGLTVEREVAGLGSGNSAYRLRAVDAGEGRTLVIFDDITQTRLTERMRVDFVANASHELRTPLATLSGFIETLQGPAAEDEPARRRFLDIMAREAARMSRLIDDLLSLSRIELDKHVRPVTVLDLDGVIADVGKTLAMRLDADERQLIIEEADALPPVIADRDQVLQVLHNLISNALKYGRSGTPITVMASVEPAGGGLPAVVRLSVSDISEGIAAEHLPRLTERFYRVDSLRSRKMGGTGLGLAIVKHIVERHRGRLEIESRPGEGTRVSFTLPQAARETARETARESASGGGRESVHR